MSIYAFTQMYVYSCVYLFIFLLIKDRPKNVLIHSRQVAYPYRINILKYFIFFIYTYIHEYSVSLFFVT